MKSRLILLAVMILQTEIASSQNIADYNYIPKPSSVTGLANPVINLNGIWYFQADPGKPFWKSPDPGRLKWAPINVPGEWVMQGFTVKPGTRAAYWKNVDIPSGWKGKRIILKCDGLYSDAAVYFNGKLSGTHLGGFTPAQFDLTGLANPGKQNQLVIGLVNESLADTLASASQYAAHQLGGITRKAEIFAVPETYIRNYEIKTDLREDSTDALLNIRMTIDGIKELLRPRLTLEVTLTLAENPDRTVLFRSYPLESRSKTYPEEFSVSLEVPKPLKWDPEHPNLYTAELRFFAGGKLVESVKSVLAFREILVAGNQVFVNGQPIKLRGVCRHEVHPTKGRSLSMNEWREDVRLFKEANVNYIRTSHYPPAEEFIALCDSAGFFVELESPLCWIGHGANPHWQKADPHDLKLYPLIRQQILETIAQYRSHPSVLIWSMANESAWGPVWDSILHEINRIDPSRPVSFHDQAYGGYNNYGSSSVQIANFHYPGPPGPDIARNFSRPLLFGEYCHLNCYNRQEIAADPGVRDDWGRGLEAMWENMYYSRGNLGGAIWSGIDDVFYLPDGRAVGYGEWGPIDGWRRPKPEYWHLKKTYSPVKIGITSLKAPVEGEPLLIPVENRSLFSNLEEMEFIWKTKKETGQSVARAEPRQTGLLPVLPSSGFTDGDQLEISIYSPQKYLVDSYLISIGNTRNFAGRPEKSVSKPEIVIQGDRILVIQAGMEWTFNAKTGDLIGAGKPGNHVITGNPRLMMLPLATGPCVTDYKLDIEPLNTTCTGGKGRLAGSGKKDGEIWLKTEADYEEAGLRMTWLFDSLGSVRISYELESKIETNPRQVGLVFTLPREYEHFSWERQAQWTVYPDDHIGRPSGTVLPFPDGSGTGFRFGIKPTWGWSSDISPMGSNDFRATRERICHAVLKGPDSFGLSVSSDGRDAVRCWINGSNVQMLVASFFTGGGDLFFASHHQKERHPLKPGDKLSGTINLRMD